MEHTKIKVLIADDHSLFRKGLEQLLELENDIEVIGEASNGKEVIEKAVELNPDVILMDINMPIKNGINAIKDLKEKGCPAKIIMLTVHDDQEYLLEAIRTGASGYIMKDADVDHLLKAIRDVYRGETYIQPNLSGKLIKDFDRLNYYSVRKEFEQYNLTPREIEVLLLIADGKNNKEIANELYISEKTVKNHVSNIFKKLDVNDRTQAAIYVLKNHLK
ncbi:DNA-binding NarL/FixJ family response regulator [Caldicoprobacter guelmensis]|uniref:response regulator n=1 Tax=Caldicoprobacter guelmensis TaxID=1170224 RepID=UPI00195AE0C8|nr:response regulator transcription factor [Caldicoprobacter guelmensis]MBM7581512.1 DNA-binding NarL/FixJ family response regulator [Caldicoprobacter guelmensis]